MLPTVNVALVVFGSEESEIANKALLLLVLGLEIMVTRFEMLVLRSQVGAMYVAVLTKPRLVNGFVVDPARLILLLIVDGLGDVFLY